MVNIFEAAEEILKKIDIPTDQILHVICGKSWGTWEDFQYEHEGAYILYQQQKNHPVVIRAHYWIMFLHTDKSGKISWKIESSLIKKLKLGR